MKNKYKFLKRNWWKYLAAMAIVSIIVSCSVDILEIVLPNSGKINAGDNFTTTVKAKWSSAGDNLTKTLVVGVLVPKSWAAAQNTSITFDCPPKGANNERMSLIPATTREKVTQLDWPTALKRDSRYGLMGNLIDDLEWLVFQSGAKTYDLTNGEAPEFTITITTKAGMENMIANMGFFIGNTSNGLDLPNNDGSYSTAGSKKITVENGVGDIVDLVNPQIAMMELARATDNDIQTIYYDGDVTPTDLSSSTDIFLCAKGFLSDGSSIEVCDRKAASAFKPMPGLNRFRFDFWPREYFHLTGNQTLSRIEYYLTNSTGTITIGYGGSKTDPFKFTFRCED